MSFYPVFLDLKGRLVLVIGGGRVAARKAASLLEAGASVRLVSLEFHPAAKDLAGDPAVSLNQRAFEPGDFKGACLCICATNDEATNRAVAAEAKKRGIFVNVVDVPQHCSFIVPASLRRGELCLAISTGGASPAAARWVRRSLEDRFGPEWGPYLRLMRKVRGHVLAGSTDSDANKALFTALAESELRLAVAGRDPAAVNRILESVLGHGHDLAMLGLGPSDLIPEEE